MTIHTIGFAQKAAEKLFESSAAASVTSSCFTESIATAKHHSLVQRHAAVTTASPAVSLAPLFKLRADRFNAFARADCEASKR
jgi:hypothetical protein